MYRPGTWVTVVRGNGSHIWVKLVGHFLRRFDDGLERSVGNVSASGVGGAVLVEWANVSELCRRFGVSRKTGYEWLSPYAAEGRAGLADQSRRPKVSAGQFGGDAEARVLALRRERTARRASHAHGRLSHTRCFLLQPVTYGGEEHQFRRTVSRLSARPVDLCCSRFLLALQGLFFCPSFFCQLF